mmetsp:Transcript_14956/g.58590  ORF Transcript_14956/g.58590 Transcript_14956/m.58590 type:complete len:388 (-) Transcript_14956:282-1445(-)
MSPRSAAWASSKSRRCMAPARAWARGAGSVSMNADSCCSHSASASLSAAPSRVSSSLISVVGSASVAGTSSPSARMSSGNGWSRSIRPRSVCGSSGLAHRACAPWRWARWRSTGVSKALSSMMRRARGGPACVSAASSSPPSMSGSTQSTISRSWGWLTGVAPSRASAWAPWPNTSTRVVGASACTRPSSAAWPALWVACTITMLRSAFTEGIGKGSQLGRGSRSSNSLPRPGVLRAVSSPPMRSTSARQMARPMPVPPKRRDAPASSCPNGVNRRASCSGAMPTPLSRTRSRQAPSSSRAAVSRTWPAGVNLTALTSNSVISWVSRAASPRRAPAAPSSCGDSISHSSSSCLAWAAGRTASKAPPSKSSNCRGSDTSCRRPASRSA